MEDVLDESLEHGGDVGQTERHYLVLVMPIAHVEGHFLDVICVDADLVISPLQINLGKDLGTKESVSEVVNEGDGELVLNHDVVEHVVLYRPKGIFNNDLEILLRGFSLKRVNRKPKII